MSELDWQPGGEMVNGASGEEIAPTPKPRKGWGFPAASRKAHYFYNDWRSQCGRWLYTGLVEDIDHEHPDNCAECMKRRVALEKRLAKGKVK